MAKSKVIVGIIGIGLSGLLTFCGHAHAETRVVDGNNKNIYFDTKGTKLTPLDAFKKGEKGEQVLACKYQDFECNERTGKCTLKNSR